MSSLFSKRASLWITEREYNSTYTPPLIKKNTLKRLLFHCASLGEYEIAKVYIEELENEVEGLEIYISFFSPSGYKYCELNEGWKKLYLPIDLDKEMRLFVDRLKPSLVFFVKNEFWFNLLNILKYRNIPYGFLSSEINDSKWFFKISKFNDLVENAIFALQTHPFWMQSRTPLTQIKIDDIRLLSAAKNASNKERKLKISSDYPIFVLGSVHRSDIRVIKPLIEAYKDQFIFIVVPHDIHLSEIQYWKERLSLELISLESSKHIDQNIIINTIGQLKELYSYGAFNYIGGGLKEGVHNIFEALVYGKPTFYPNVVKPIKTKISNAYPISHFEEMFQIIEADSLDQKDLNIDLTMKAFKKESLSIIKDILA